jgi:hypothetical protein
VYGLVRLEINAKGLMSETLALVALMLMLGGTFCVGTLPSVLETRADKGATSGINRRHLVPWN